MRYMLMMHGPRGTGDYQVNDWPPEDFEAHIAFMRPAPVGTAAFGCGRPLRHDTDLCMVLAPSRPWP